MQDQKTRYLFSNDYVINPLKFGSVYLVQIGRRFCAPAQIIPTHPHLNWFELTVITSGKGQIVTNGEKTNVKAGDIYLSFPCDVHEIIVDENSKLEYDFFSFYCEDRELKKSLNSITRKFRGGNARVFEDTKISALIQSAITEFPLSDKLFAKPILTNIFNLIVAYIVRNFNDIKQKTPAVSKSEVTCYQIMNYIDTHIYSLQNLAAVAEKFNYNYSYLSKTFKKVTGDTLLEYFLRRKMDVAKALIIENKKSISEIAEMLGYNLYSFSKSFKATYGVSPKNMQKSFLTQKE